MVYLGFAAGFYWNCLMIHYTGRVLCAALIFLPVLAVPVVAQSEEIARQKVIAFAQDTMANDWRRAQVRQFQEGLSGSSEVKFVYSDAAGDTGKQIRDIEDYLYSGVDILVTSPQNSAMMAPVISSAYRNGTPVLLLSRTIVGNDYTSFIHPDNRAIARQAANYIARELNGNGTVFMLMGIEGTSTVHERTEGFEDVMSKYPGIKLVRKTANYLRADAIRATEEIISKATEIDAIYAQSDSMAVGAIMALKMAGIDPKPLVIVGIDYIDEARALIRERELDATYLYPTAGSEGAKVARDILAGKKVPKEIIIDSVEITLENVEQIEPIF